MSCSKKSEENFYIKKDLKVAIVHDWLVTYRGGEKVLQSIASLFPEAPIYTLFYKPSQLGPWFQGRDIRVPPLLNRLQKVRKLLLPLLPSLIESLPMNDYDLILSTSSCVAKGVLPSVYAKHICYIHSPMRYIWDQRDEYFRSIQNIPLLSTLIEYLCSQLRIWDVQSAGRVDRFIANSNFVKARVARYYQRDSSVIHPPVNLDRFKHVNTSQRGAGRYFLIAGAFVSYKRFDLAIEACNNLGFPLVVAGSGPMEKKLRKIAKSNVSFVISPSDEKLTELFSNAIALIFPGVEDFGILPIEAMACGTPVIAFAKGGACDFIEENRNGVFFHQQNLNSLIQCLQEFNAGQFDRNEIVSSTKSFSEERFLEQIKEEILRTVGT